MSKVQANNFNIKKSESIMRLFLGIICIFSFTFMSYGQKVLSLNEAVNIALQKNTTLKKAVNNIESNKSSVKAAYGNFLPTIGANASWSWSRNKQKAGGSYTFSGITINQPAITSESRSYSASVGGNLTLFDGLSEFANLSQSKKNLKSAQLSLENLKQNIVFQTMSLYYTVVNDQQLLKVQQDNVKWNKKNLETITERNKLGAVTLADVYSAQVQNGNAQLGLIKAKNDFETAKSNLLYYLGLNVFENYNFEDSLTAQEEDLLKTNLTNEYQNMSDLVKKALDNRPDYESAKLNVLSAEEGVTMAFAGHLPKLTGNYDYYLHSNTLHSLSDLSNSQTYSLGLTLSIPIFSGFSVENRVEQAKVNVMNSKVDLEDLRRTINQNIQTTYLNLQAAKTGLEVSKNNVKAGEENLKIAQEKYSLGSGTLLDLLTANYNYTNARTNYINSEFQYIVLNEQLKYYLGVLNYKKYE
jgi:outer membrane protein